MTGTRFKRSLGYPDVMGSSRDCVPSHVEQGLVLDGGKIRKKMNFLERI